MANPPSDLTDLIALNGVTFTNNEVSLGDGITGGPAIYNHITNHTQIANNVNTYSSTTTFTISNVDPTYTAGHTVASYYYQPTFGSFTVTIDDGTNPTTTETLFVHGFEDNGQGLLVSTDQNLVWYPGFVGQAVNGSSFPFTYEHFGVIETTPVPDGPIAPQHFHGATPPTDVFHLNGVMLAGNQISLGGEAPVGAPSANGVSIDANASDLSANVLSINNIISLAQSGYGIGYDSGQPNRDSAVIQNVQQAYTEGHITNGHYYMPTFGSLQLVAPSGNTETLFIHGYEDNGRALLVSSSANLYFNPSSDAYEHGYASPSSLDSRFGIISLDPLTQGAQSIPLTFVPGPGDGSAFVAPCYAEGARLSTTRGEVAVEDLVVGDEMVLAGGGTRPVIWIGSRRVRCDLHPRPGEVNPVRIKAGAFGPELPVRDLVVSPGHAVFVDGVLIPAHALINGATIVQEEVRSVRYFHVELDAHDVMLAEGLACESYLDDGNRESFANAPEHTTLFGRLDPLTWDQACAPMVAAGPQLTQVQARLHARAQALGWVRSDEPGLTLLVDGVAIAPLLVRGGRWWFAVPAAAELKLVSNAAILSQVLPGLSDARRLGVAVAEVRLDGEALDLSGEAFAQGFHALETDEASAWRWTDGAATLALPLREPSMLEVALRMVAPTWKRPATKLRLVQAG